VDTVPEVPAGGRHSASPEGHRADNGTAHNGKPALVAPASLSQVRDGRRQGSRFMVHGSGGQHRGEVGAGGRGLPGNQALELFKGVAEFGGCFEAGITEHRLDAAILLGFAGAGHDAAWSFSVTISRSALSPRR
jgi:hypothetical protein